VYGERTQCANPDAEFDAELTVIIQLVSAEHVTVELIATELIALVELVTTELITVELLALVIVVFVILWLEPIEQQQRFAESAVSEQHALSGRLDLIEHVVHGRFALG
jgi:hypothetical protein